MIETIAEPTTLDLEQRRESEELRQLSSAGLQREWNFLWEHDVPFWAAKYRAAGLHPGPMPPLCEIPLTRAKDLRIDEKRNPPLGGHRPVSLDFADEVSLSYDVDGSPFINIVGHRDREVRQLLLWRELRRLGVGVGVRVAYTMPPSSLGRGLADALDEIGAVGVPVGSAHTDGAAVEHLQLWQASRPSVYLVTGNELRSYIKLSRSIGVDPRSVFGGANVAASDPLFQYLSPRQRMEEILDARVHVLVSTPGVPMLALGDCTHHTGVHVPSDYVHVELCDPATGAESAISERGHLVVSTFGLDGLWIRFDLEQYGSLSGSSVPCPCGETGQRVVLHGPARSAVVAGDRTFLPLDARLALEDPLLPRLQILPTREGRLRIQIEPGADTSALCEKMTESLGVACDVIEAPQGWVVE